MLKRRSRESESEILKSQSRIFYLQLPNPGWNYKKTKQDLDLEEARRLQ